MRFSFNIQSLIIFKGIELINVMLQGSLVSILDEQTNDFIRSITDGKPTTLGLVRSLNNGKWDYTWKDGSLWNYNKWDFNEPSNKASNLYVKMVGNSNGIRAFWTTVSDLAKHGYVCQQGM